MKSITSGIVGLEDFAGEDVTAILEYNINPPNDIAEKDFGFRFPLRPDAVLISSDKTKWLVLESKHSFTNSHILQFAKKCEFINARKQEKWVTKKQHVCPVEIVPAVCSVHSFSDVPVTTKLPVTRD